VSLVVPDVQGYFRGYPHEEKAESVGICGCAVRLIFFVSNCEFIVIDPHVPSSIWAVSDGLAPSVRPNPSWVCYFYDSKLEGKMGYTVSHGREEATCLLSIVAWLGTILPFLLAVTSCLFVHPFANTAKESVFRGL